jgi:zinc protease
MTINIKKTVLTIIAGISLFQATGQSIPLDSAVRTGKLANGFTYYIRKNNEPQKRVQLYLVNKVGSILEDDDQQGLAHFMEHMNFNGTKNYPKNELVDYLQKAGVRFGADLNAYTSFDETVYELPIPTDNPSMTANGLKIMRDWAQEALLDSIEIDKERGVVLEEERLGKGAKDRMSRKYYPVTLNHSHYADRLPIGLDKVLIDFKPDVIRRFHHDWYRPDLQALIVVGDVNVDEIESMIRDKFSDLKNPADERPRTNYTVPLTGHSQFLTVTDKENASTDIEILYKHKAQGLKTQADYLASMKRALLNQLITARNYAEAVRAAKPGYISMNASIQGFLGGLDMFAFDVTAKSGQLRPAFEETWRVMERIRRFGFTEAELDRAKQNYLRTMDEGLKEKDKTPSESFVKEYQRLFLQNEASPGIEWEARFVRQHMDEIKLADISSILNEYIGSKDMDILITAPDNEKASLPDSATLMSWVNAVHQENITPFKEDQINHSLLTEQPKPGKITGKTFMSELNLTQLTLSNGVRVILKPTDFKNDEIRFIGVSAGGLTLYDEGDYDNAANAAALIGQFGAGDLNPVQLSNVLNGKVLNVSANIGLRSETVGGISSVADLETALQLAYLKITRPRADTTLFNNIMSNVKERQANRYADPGNALVDTMNYVLGDYNSRFAPMTADRINHISLKKAGEIYKERFADASGFTFVFVGNFNVDTITPLLEKYLGSLPSLHRNEKARDLGIHIPEGKLTKKVFKGTENKATVRLIFSGAYRYSPENNLFLKALGSILQIKVLQHLREDESEVYNPSVQTSYSEYPQSRYAVSVFFGCAPKNVDHLIDMVEKEMATLREQGPAADDIGKFKAEYVKNVELALKDNSFWLGYLSGQYENNEDVRQVLDVEKNLKKATNITLKTAATDFLSSQNEIRFELLPEANTTN